MHRKVEMDFINELNLNLLHICSALPSDVLQCPQTRINCLKFDPLRIFFPGTMQTTLATILLENCISFAY